MAIGECIARIRSVWGGVVSTLLLVGLASLLVSCNSRSVTVPDEVADSPSDTATETDDVAFNGVNDSPPVYIPEVSTGPTLGERLGQLDAKIRTASSDSVELLEAEYQRLLDSASGRSPAVAQTAPQTDTASLPVPSAKPSKPKRDSRVLSQTLDVPVDSVEANPARLFNGLRASEIEYYKKQQAAENSSSGGSTPAQKSRTTTRKARTAQATARTRTSISEDQFAERVTDGIVSAQAGRYDKAVESLGPVIANSATKPVVRYYYALSLEKTGDIEGATRQYFALSQSQGAMGEKAYIDYCRVLAMQGKNDNARQLVIRFIETHPDSTLVVDARRLLQTL